MLRTPSLRALLAVYARLLCSCAFAPDFPADAAIAAPEVSAVDARGREVPLDRLPRRPRLRVTLRAQMTPWLLRGGCDAALLDDLDKLPLNAAHQSRSVAVRHRWDGEHLEIEPIEALAGGDTYTLALPRKAAMGLAQPFATELQIEDSPLAGAAIRDTFPAAESASVPTDLAYAVISFDGRVTGSESGVWLEDVRGLAHPAQSEDVACDEYDTAAASCIRLHPTLPLQAASRYSLRSGSALRDAHGAALTELHAAFTTQNGTQAEAATWQPGPCGVDEQSLPFGCALLSDISIELQLFQNPSLRVIAQLQDQRVALLPGTRAALYFDSLTPDFDYTLSFETIDGSLNSEPGSWQLHTTTSLPTLAISEINANPRGSEPEQEYVELWNFGTEPVRLDGLLVSDSQSELGVPIPGHVSLPPAARALLVSDGFDATDTNDLSPAAGSLIVRIGKTITRGGLANSGERLFLRTLDAHRVSSSPAEPAAPEGQCLQRDEQNTRESAPWRVAACSPGR
jgi:hypothetical protein